MGASEFVDAGLELGFFLGPFLPGFITEPVVGLCILEVPEVRSGVFHPPSHPLYHDARKHAEDEDDHQDAEHYQAGLDEVEDLYHDLMVGHIVLPFYTLYMVTKGLLFKGVGDVRVR